MRKVVAVGALAWCASLWLALALDAALPSPPLRPSAEPFVVEPHWCFRSAMVGRPCAIEPVEV